MWWNYVNCIFFLGNELQNIQEHHHNIWQALLFLSVTLKRGLAVSDGQTGLFCCKFHAQLCLQFTQKGQMPCLGQGSEWAKWCETIKGDRNANNHWFPTKMCTMPSLKHTYKLISSVAGTSKATSESGWWVSVPTSSWLPSRSLSCVAKFWRRSTSPCTSIRTLSWPCPIRSSAMRQGWSGCSFPSTPWCSSFTWITEICATQIVIAWQ